MRQKSDDEDLNPDGYVRRVVPVYSRTENEQKHLRIFLPATPQTDALILELDAEAKAAASAYVEEQKRILSLLKKESEAKSDESDSNASDNSTSPNSGSSSSGTFGYRKKQGVDVDIEFEQAALDKRHQHDLALEDPFLVEVYEVEEPLKLVQHKGSSTPDKEAHKRYREMFERLKEMGNFRRLASPSKWADGLDKLKSEQPHFGEVIDFVRQQFALSVARGSPIRIPPVLLLGEPGVGKTHFTKALAKVMEAPLHRVAFDSALTTSSLLGSDRNWANTSNGQVFDLVCLGTHANPIFLLDEIDKASRDDRYNPLASLHSLLEPVTSNKVKDISLELEFDASYITWISTANQHWLIPASIRSRFEEFHIEAPSGEFAIQLATEIEKAVRQEMLPIEFKLTPSSVVTLLAHLTAREQRQALHRAFANAVVNQRDQLTKHDLPADVLFIDSESTGYVH